VHCQNNLKQIGLALHMYHDVHGSLPMGCLEWRSWNAPPTQRQFAWSAMLLPFLEQQAVHEAINFSLPFDHEANADAAATRLSVYECPSNVRQESKRGPTDYGGLYGERLVDRRTDDGLFLYETSLRLADVLDGTSQTLAVAEDIGGPDSEWINGRNVFVQAHGINDAEAWVGDNEIRSQHPGGAMCLFADGHVEFLSDSTPREILGGMITRSRGEVLSDSVRAAPSSRF